MKNNLVCKFITTIIIIFFAVSMFNSSVGAASNDNFNLETFENGDTSVGSAIKDPVEKVMGGIVAAMRIICTGVAILLMMMIGIKYISSAPGERAEIKKSAIQYIVGAIILFGASGILIILEGFINRTINS